MRKDFITFRSITPAQRAQRLLRQSGVETVLQRTPRRMEQKGCGYCLRLQPEQRQLALQLLQHTGIQYGKIYADTDGVLEELTL